MASGSVENNGSCVRFVGLTTNSAPVIPNETLVVVTLLYVLSWLQNFANSASPIIYSHVKYLAAVMCR